MYSKCGKQKTPTTTISSLTSTWNHSKRPRNTRDMTTASSRSQESDGIRPFTFSKLVGLSDRCYRSTAVGQTVYYSVQVYTLYYRRRASVLVMFGTLAFAVLWAKGCQDLKTVRNACPRGRVPASRSSAHTPVAVLTVAHVLEQPGATLVITLITVPTLDTSAARSGDRRAPTILPQSTRDI